MHATSRSLLIGLGLLVSAGLISGCGSKSGSGGASATLKADNPPITDEELQQFAGDLERAVNSGDSAAVNALLDWPRLMDQVTAGLQFDNKVRDNFRKGAETGFSTQLTNAVTSGAHYSLLHTHESAGRKRALFRMLLPNQTGLNYHDFILARGNDGRPHAIDINIMAAGEKLSQLLRRNFIAAVEHDSRGILQRLTGRESAYAKSLPELQVMMNDIQEGRGAKALETYEKLPPEVRQEKSVMILRMRAAQATSAEEYSRALDDISRQFGKDPAMSLLLLDGYAIKKEYDEALACVDRLDAMIEGDPYLDVMRAHLLRDKGDLPEASRRVNQALQALPNLLDVYWCKMSLALRERNFDQVLSLLETIGAKFNMQFNDLTQVEEYREFVKSPQYQTWLLKNSLPQGRQVAP